MLQTVPVASSFSSRAGRYDATATAARYTLRLLAERIQALTTEERDLQQRITAVLNTHAPQLLQRHGIGPDSASALLVIAGDNPDRMHNEASFAALCGVSPIEAGGGCRAPGLHDVARRHRANAANLSRRVCREIIQRYDASGRPYPVDDELPHGWAMVTLTTDNHDWACRRHGWFLDDPLRCHHNVDACGGEGIGEFVVRRAVRDQCRHGFETGYVGECVATKFR
jgi:hypothetical protein